MQVIEENRDSVLETEAREIRKQKAALGIEAVGIDSELKSLRSQMHLLRGTSRHSHLRNIQDRKIERRNQINAAIIRLNSALQGIHLKRSELQRNAKSLKSTASKTAAPVELREQIILNHVRSLIGLRKHYQDFSADLTRISSMRQMAAEFAVKLGDIIEGINGVT